MHSQNTLIVRLDALETFLCLLLPIRSLEYRDHLETIAQARRELKDCWRELANQVPVIVNECPKCDSDRLRCLDCGWKG